jgi:hypothetical protein
VTGRASDFSESSSLGTAEGPKSSQAEVQGIGEERRAVRNGNLSLGRKRLH